MLKVLLLLQLLSFYFAFYQPLSPQAKTLWRVKDLDDSPQTISDDFRRKIRFTTSTLINLHLYPLLFRSIAARAKDDNGGAIGFDAAESAFSPLRKLYSIPLLPQSALLNSLPLDNVLVGQIQADLESFIQLINPTKQQILQLQDPQSRLWINLQNNAQRAAGIFFYNQNQLKPYSEEEDSLGLNNIRNEQFTTCSELLKKHLLLLVDFSKECNIQYSLRCVRNALNDLHLLAYLQVPLKLNSASNRALFKDKSFYDGKNDQVVLESIKPLPRLLGRAIVKLTFERPGIMKLLPSTKLNAETIRDSTSEESIINEVSGESTIEGKAIGSFSEQNPYGDVLLVVDGINHPFTAGNFIDLCNRKFYENIPVKKEMIEYSGSEIVNYTILGYSPFGYRDPITDQLRKIPLEIYREDNSRNRYTVIGSAQNSAVYTNAIPVMSFATVSFIQILFNHFPNHQTPCLCIVWCNWNIS